MLSDDKRTVKMTEIKKLIHGGKWTSNRFVLLLFALLILLFGYPYLQDNQLGAFLGGLMSLALLVTGIFAVRTHKLALYGAIALALVAISLSVIAFLSGIRGHPLVEGAFFLFYVLTTTVIFVEVIRRRSITREILAGVICVYLLIGTTFATLYDLIETIHPGSFQYNIAIAGNPQLRWRNMIYYSFMTLTTIGYGDMTPATAQTQSLSIIEGVIGVLFLAVFIARLIGMYNHATRSSDDQ